MELAVKRILIALDTSRRGQPALQAAARLAAGTGAELAGLFVEDINLLRLAGLPFAREMGMLAGSRALGLPDVERALRVEAARAQRMLAEAARESQAHWTFRIARGQMVVEALAEAADLLVMAKSEHLAAFTPSRSRWRAETPVFVMFDPGLAGYRILAAGLKLAQGLGVGLTVLIAARTPLEFEQGREAALAWLGGQTVSARVLWLATPEQGGLGALVRSGRGAALVLHETSLPAARAALDALLGAVECPLIVVRRQGDEPPVTSPSRY